MTEDDLMRMRAMVDALRNAPPGESALQKLRGRTSPKGGPMMGFVKSAGFTPPAGFRPAAGFTPPAGFMSGDENPPY